MILNLVRAAAGVLRDRLSVLYRATLQVVK